jgi:hypothetical protein
MVQKQLWQPLRGNCDLNVYRRFYDYTLKSHISHYSERDFYKTPCEKIVVFWNVRPCSLVGAYRNSGAASQHTSMRLHSSLPSEPRDNIQPHKALCCFLTERGTNLRRRSAANEQQATSERCKIEAPDLYVQFLFVCLNTSPSLGFITYLINMYVLPHKTSNN